MMTRLPFGMSAAVATAGLLGLSTGPALAADLTVTSFGGAMQDAHREVYFEPFKQETGIDLVEDVWNGGVGAIRAKVEGGDVAVSLGSGAIPESHVRGTLADLCRTPPRREIQAITAFKSVGAALEDLAAAMLVWRSLAKAL